MIGLFLKGASTPVFTYDQTKQESRFVGDSLMARTLKRGANVPPDLQASYHNKSKLSVNDGADFFNFFKDYYIQKNMASTLDQYEWRSITPELPPSSFSSEKNEKKEDPIQKTSFLSKHIKKP